MALSEQDKKFLKSLPGKTEFLNEKEPETPQKVHKIAITNANGMTHTIEAKDMKDVANSLVQSAENFDLQKAAQNFVNTFEASPEYKKLVQAKNDWNDFVESIAASIPKELKTRAAVIEDYINADTADMNKGIEELKEMETQTAKKVQAKKQEIEKEVGK